MPEDVISQRRFPVRCPACGALEGFPTIVETVRSQPGRIRIGITCQACRTHWFQDVDSEGT